jgi:hypothetical protein
MMLKRNKTIKEKVPKKKEKEFGLNTILSI